MKFGFLRVLLLLALQGCKSLRYLGELELKQTPGGLFGAVTNGQDAWFGVDGYPAMIVRVRLRSSAKTGEQEDIVSAAGTPMQEVGRLQLKKEEERLWALVAEPLQEGASSWFAYVGVGNPPGRLVKVNLLSMERVGYVQLTTSDIRGGVVVGPHAYFVTSAKPSTVLRCPTVEMFHGDSFRPLEVALALGEHNVQAVFADSDGKHIILGTYTQPARIVKLAIPDMTKSASLTLPVQEQMIYCGALWEEHGIFGTSTLPGRLVKVNLQSMTHVSSVEFFRGEDRAVSIVVWRGQAFVGLANEWEQDTSSIIQVDLQTMKEVAALVTPKGCTWLYAAVGWQDEALFGSRYHDSSFITRVSLPVAKPDIPEIPSGNASGQVPDEYPPLPST
eukprot:768448-Hanusia_phi.AAC.10